ncbi:MAG: ATP-binding protein, partial [Actinomycetales bacterium]
MSCTTTSLPFTISAASQARQLLRDDLSSANHADETFIEMAELIVSELVSNAFRHGRPSPQQTLELSWHLDESHLVVSVCDHGDFHPLQPLHPPREAEGGRGLGIIDALCDEWTVTHDHLGMRVTA